MAWGGYLPQDAAYKLRIVLWLIRKFFFCDFMRVISLGQPSARFVYSVTKHSSCQTWYFHRIRNEATRYRLVVSESSVPKFIRSEENKQSPMNWTLREQTAWSWSVDLPQRDTRKFLFSRCSRLTNWSQGRHVLGTLCDSFCRAAAPR